MCPTKNLEIETKMMRRECIASIIDILSANHSEDKEGNLRRIKEEFVMNESWSSGKVLKKLIEMRRQLDTELGRKRWRGIRQQEAKVKLESGGEPTLKPSSQGPNGRLGSRPKLKLARVHLERLPSTFMTTFPKVSLAQETQTSTTQLKKFPHTLVALLCKGKTKTKKQQRLRKRVTWWDGYQSEANA